MAAERARAETVVYIATSLDGYIARENHDLDWLPQPDGADDFGYGDFMASVQAIIMGRRTMEAVVGFDCDWPYDKPVTVMSSSLEHIPDKLEGKQVTVRSGGLSELLQEMRQQSGVTRVYVDGGTLIRSLLEQDLVDEMVLTTVPVLIGGGVRLFGNLERDLVWEHMQVECAGGMVKNRYRRSRDQ
eukprot:TRINITY_DN15413_c0_g1_i2.p1 TRINITY_DN15413_c0_g1~~TRINITY_DN15413_c0_g1_i2.p1  ORF type:complete len:186 (-),score=45.66 TRINITY_DN15413_c0_g1_i2:423-980(-)